MFVSVPSPSATQVEVPLAMCHNLSTEHYLTAALANPTPCKTLLHTASSNAGVKRTNPQLRCDITNMHSTKRMLSHYIFVIAIIWHSWSEHCLYSLSWTHIVPSLFNHPISIALTHVLIQRTCHIRCNTSETLLFLFLNIFPKTISKIMSGLNCIDLSTCRGVDTVAPLGQTSI